MSIRINYKQLMLEVDKDEFEKFYRVHNTEEVANRFGLHSKYVAKTLAKKWDIHKTAEDSKNTLFNTNIARYGTKYAQCSNTVRQKISNTVASKECQERMRETSLKNNGFENVFQDREHIRNTLIERYGVDNPMKDPDIKEKSSITWKHKSSGELSKIHEQRRSTRIRLYGRYVDVEKIKKTKLLRYGNENYCNIEKAKQTCLEKYGVDSYSKTPEYKNRYTPQFISHMKSVEYNTRKLHSTFNTSYIEDYCYSILDKAFPNMIQKQFRSNEYPYSCDFYISEMKLYIEYQGTWTHGPEPYDENNIEHMQRKEDLECKAHNSNFYKNALYTWTDLDVRKLNALRSCNLNYLMVYPSSNVVIASNDQFKWIGYMLLFFSKKRRFPFIKVKDSLSPNTLIKSYHKSIYLSKRNELPSPYEAWFNDDLMVKVFKNRHKYNEGFSESELLQGLNVSGIAKKVSVFSPTLAKRLINTYLNDFDTIFDPFSGFSGRLLGAYSLNKSYIGQDIEPTHVMESNEIIKHIEGSNITVVQADSLQTTGTYDCLFTCPPYGNKEWWGQCSEVYNYSCDYWIAQCLKNYNCLRYLFVVDNTELYKEFVVEEIHNKSHFGENIEYLILIDKEANCYD